MTVMEIKERMQEYVDEGYGELEVKIAQQPSWPLAGKSESACRIGDTVWIASGEAGEYAPRAAWDGEDADDDSSGEE